MKFLEHPMYKEFEGEVWKTWKAQANLLVVTVAGMSENFFAKKFCEKEAQIGNFGGMNGDMLLKKAGFVK